MTLSKKFDDMFILLDTIRYQRGSVVRTDRRIELVKQYRDLYDVCSAYDAQ